MELPLHWLVLIPTTLYHWIASALADRTHKPLGQLMDVGGVQLHYWEMGEAQHAPIVVLDHSLGGIEGYFLIHDLSKLTKVVIYDRAGYGWSQQSPHERTSRQIVQELDTLLTQAKIQPPYILVGDSFGSYNMRLYAHQFPEKVAGLVLTDGLHESGILKMPLGLRLLKVVFLSGFVMSTIGAATGIIRLLENLHGFELLKPQLRRFPQPMLRAVKRSFLRPQHWITMGRELWSMDESGRQLTVATQLGDLPVINLKSKTFFRQSPWTFYMPNGLADRLRDTMHTELMQLSTNCIQIEAQDSDHFVWIDQPELITKAVQLLLSRSSKTSADTSSY
jgi:pimeloyl-ACP methyl ester carboxylesterase